MFDIFKKMFGQTDNSELLKVLDNKPYFVDVRTPAEYASGSVKGSVNIPLSNLLAQIKKFKNKKSIVVFCRTGARSGSAKRILEQNGFENVINGGSWQNVVQAMNQNKEDKVR